MQLTDNLHLPMIDRLQKPVISGCSLLLVPAVICVLLLIPAEPLEAQQASRSMDRDTLQTGDIFRYHMRLQEVEDFDEVIYPDSADFGADFVIRNRQVITDDRGDSLIYTLQFFGVDTQRVPELHAGLREGADTLFVVIPAASFIYEPRVDDEEAELRPLKPIFPFLRNWWPWILAALVLAAVAVFLWYRYRDRLFGQTVAEEVPEPVAEPFRSPLKKLRTKLKWIETSYKKPATQAKAYYTEIGDAFRTYFELTHHFPAMESTTGEVIRELERRRFDEEVIRLTSSILQEADLVKFAKHQPNESACRDVMEKSLELAGRIAETDRTKIEELRNRHEEEQQRKLTEDHRNDLG